MTPPPSGPRDWTPPPGPRDWSPFEQAQPTNRHPLGKRANTARNRTGYFPDRRPSGSGAAWWSAFLGLGALALAMMQPGYTTLGNGFIVSTVGISAIAYGIYALSTRRRRATRIAVPIAGVVMGAAGTALMVFYLTTYLVTNPNLDWTAYAGGDPVIQMTATPVDPAYPVDSAYPVDPAYPVPPPAPQAVDAPEVVPVPMPADAPPYDGTVVIRVPDIDTMPIRQAMQVAAGTISYLMREATEEGDPWPTTLAVTTDDRSVMMPTGEIVGWLPQGAQLSYQPTPDLMDFVLVITDPVTGGAVEYSTVSGVVMDR
jgi:hypothetical protein